MAYAPAGAEQVPNSRMSGPVFILSFCPSLKLACGMNTVHDVATLWLLYFFMKSPAAASLNACIALKLKFHRSQSEGTVTSSCAAIHKLLETYTTEGIIADTNINMMTITQVQNGSPTEHVEALWNKALQRDRVYDEYVLKRIFIEWVSESTSPSNITYWGLKRNAIVQDLVRHSNSIAKLQKALYNTCAFRLYDQRTTDAKILDNGAVVSTH